MKKGLFVFLALLTALVFVPSAQPASAQVAQANCCTSSVVPTPSPTPLITTLPMYAYGDPGGTPCTVDGQDPGSTADKYVVSYQETCGTTAMNAGTSACTGATSTFRCTPLIYGDTNLTACVSPFSNLLFTWANANDENAFLHIINGRNDENGTAGNGTVTSANRYRVTQTGCTGGASYEMNPGDATADSWMYTNLWSTSTGVMKSGWGLFWDDTPHEAARADDITSSVEFGSVNANKGYWFQVGDDANSVGYDWETAVAKGVNAMCGNAPNCLNAIVNMWGGGASIGNNVITVRGGSHMAGELSPSKFALGYLDGVPDAVDMCSNLTNTNLLGGVYERNVTPSSGATPDPSLTASTLNEAITLVHSHSSDGCSATHIVQLNQPTGATFSTSLQERSYVMAMAGLVPSRDGSPDEIINWAYPIGCVSSCTGSIVEFPYFPEYTIVGFNPEVTLTPTVYGGHAANDHFIGCEGFGDTGGTTGLVVGTVGSGSSCTAVYAMPYSDCYVGGVDQGPCVYILNATASSVALSSLTFGVATPWNYAATFSGGQVGVNSTGLFSGGNITYPAAPGGVVSMATGCSSTTAGICDGTMNLSGTPLCASPPCGGSFSFTLAAQTGYVLFEGSGGSGGPPTGGTTLWSTSDISTRTVSGSAFCGTTSCAMSVATGDQCTVGVNTCNQVVSGTGAASIVSFPFGQASGGGTQRNQAQPHCVIDGLQCEPIDGSQYLWHFTYIDGDATDSGVGMGTDCRSGHSCGNGVTTGCPGDVGGTCSGDARSLVWQIHPDTCSCTPLTTLNFVNGSNAVSNPQRWGIYDGGTNGTQTLEWTGTYTPGEEDTWDILVTTSSPGNCTAGSCTPNGAVKVWRNNSVVYDSSVTHPGGVVTMCCATSSFGTNKWSWWNFGPYKWIWDTSPNDSYLNTVNASYANWRYAICPC